MSNYTNFIKDFPNRCLDILSKYESMARIENREVTLLLGIATAGLIIPFERLRPPTDNLTHPGKDRQNCQAATDEFERTLKLPFLGSSLWSGDPAAWTFAKDVEQIETEPDCWDELKNKKPLSKEKKIGSVTKHIRNALAHGNLFTIGNPIQLIIFLSRCCVYVGGESVPTDKFAMLATAPNDFLKFLMNWLTFLSSLPMPTIVMQESGFELVEYGA